MVAPFVIYGAYVAGGAIAGALATWGVSKMLKSDADKIREMEIQYEQQKAIAQIKTKEAACAAERVKAEIELAKAELQKAKLLAEIKEALLRAAKAEEDELLTQQRIKKLKAGN